jgi:two-component system phosphate regulon sensor histidine kinase PhoR
LGALVGGDLFELLAEAEGRKEMNAQETLRRLLIERSPLERELEFADTPPRQYTLRMAAVLDDEGREALGLVASLSDITKQRELQQARNDVMALVTHELKTPLTAIQAMSEVLAKYNVDTGRSREMHLAINDEAKRLTAMIDEYLNITRLETGVQSLRLLPVRPAQLIERALLMLDPLAAQRKIRLVRRIAPNLPALVADADLISRALTNLVSNAIKFSSENSEVIIEAAADEGELRIEVADSGCGISAESLPRVFEKFYRVPRLLETDADVPGNGLGLALVREIAERHGGRVTVESEIGVGSLFRLRLPLH